VGIFMRKGCFQRLTTKKGKREMAEKTKNDSVKKQDSAKGKVPTNDKTTTKKPQKTTSKTADRIPEGKKPPTPPKTRSTRPPGRPKGSTDTRPRKQRSDKSGSTADQTAEMQPGISSDVPQQPTPPAEPSGPTKTERARASATALIATGSVLCGYFLPPSFSQAEAETLIEVWSPVLEMYESEISDPRVVAAIVSAGIMIPRIAAKIGSSTKSDDPPVLTRPE
jgi:hypothetical protein